MSRSNQDQRTPTWDPVIVLGIVNPERHKVTCVGHAERMSRRCQYDIAQHNRLAAAKIMRQLCTTTTTEQELQVTLRELARRLLCRKYHQKTQIQIVADHWYKLVKPYVLDKRPSRTRRDSVLSDEDVENEDGPDLDELRKRLEEELRKVEEEIRKREEQERLREIRREADEARREEARKQAAREREEREAKVRAKAERERLAEEARRKRERNAEERRRQEAITWDEAWQRYEAAWERIPNVDVQLSGDELGSMRFWPTRDGSRQLVNEAEVEKFFLRLPGDDADTRARGRLLRRQSMRWHPDKATRYFAQLQDQEEVMRLVTMIAQVLNSLKD